MRIASRILLSAVSALAITLSLGAVAQAWELAPDKGTISEAQVEEILSGKDNPETTGFSRKLDYVDFSANGMPFTQVFLRLDPEKPMLRNGKKVILVATDEGSSSLNGFITTDEGKEELVSGLLSAA